MKKILMAFIVIAMGLITGCTTFTYELTPMRNSVEEYSYKVNILPVGTDIRYKTDVDLYDSFIVSIFNKTGQPIKIDWNNTYYVQNGQANGGFMYEGIVYKDRNSPKTPDIIFPKSTYKKIIYPNNQVAFATSSFSPIVDPSQGWVHKKFTEGTHGVYLCLIIDDKPIYEKFEFDLKMVKKQQ